MKSYNHKSIEKKWQNFWKKKGVYKTENKSSRKKFFILDMFPYPSGEGLHVGHPKGYIATDIISRMKRMNGYNVLHPMGFDAFGLPAENYAIKTKTNPIVSVSKNIKRYKKQLEILGFDYDWSREVNTTDPKFYKWTQWIFLKLLEKGLAYESFEPINWCPSCKTGLANEDVEDGKCERCGTIVVKKPMRQWVLKITDYADRLLDDLDLKDKDGNFILDWPESIKESQRNWIGRSEGAEIVFKVESQKFKFQDEIKIFTTRPDTLFGVTYVVLSPELFLQKIESKKWQIENLKDVLEYTESIKNKSEIDRTDRKKEKTGVLIKGLVAINPADSSSIAVWVSDYVLSDYGTGAVIGVPAHDQRDFEFANKYNLPIKQVIAPRLIDEKNPHIKGKEVVYRRSIIAILRNPKTNEVLCLKWKKQPWTTFVMGGIDEGESPTDAAKREILEETGYKDIKFVKLLCEAQSEFFANHKDVNRIAHTYNILFDIVSDKKENVSDSEKNIHDAFWTPIKSLNRESITHSEIDLILERMEKDVPILEDGILCNSGNFNKLSSEKAKKEITRFVNGKWVKKYKLRDWVFSRQRYWGEPIPVFHDKDGNVLGVNEKDLPVVLPKVKSYEPTGTGQSPLADIKSWTLVKSKEGLLNRETNTMPQWAGSSWYYLRYMDPQNNKEMVSKKYERYWNYVDLYVGGAEHATRHLIYARFWHKFLFDIGIVSNKEPFKKLQSVGLILAEDGRKMSKRFGNVVNPDNIVDLYGADTLRVYEMFMGPFADSIKWDTKSIIGCRRFLEKIWKLYSKISKNKITDLQADSILNKTIIKVTDDISAMRFNTAISSLMILVNFFESRESVSKDNFQKLVLLLSPFAPHISEELWQMLGNKKTIVKSPWPKADNKKIQNDLVKIVVQVNGKVRGILDTIPISDQKKILDLAIKDENIYKWFKEKEIKKIIYVENKVLNVII